MFKPPGNPPPNSVKYFAVLEVLEQAKDRICLTKVTLTLNHRWIRKGTENVCRRIVNSIGAAFAVKDRLS